MHVSLDQRRSAARLGRPLLEAVLVAPLRGHQLGARHGQGQLGVGQPAVELGRRGDQAVGDAVLVVGVGLEAAQQRAARQRAAVAVAARVVRGALQAAERCAPAPATAGAPARAAAP